MRTKVITYACIVVAIFISAVVSAQSAYHPDDIGVLQNIMNNNWSSSTNLNWKTSTDTSYWTGVGWDYSTPKRITNLNLNSRSLQGDMDVSKLTSLQYLYLQYNYNISSVNASGLLNLSYLYCYDNKITDLNVSGDSNLYRLECYNNILDSLILTSCSDLYYLQASNNVLKKIEITGLSNMSYLYTYNNIYLNSIDVTGCTSLSSIYVYNNSLLLSSIIPMINLPTNPYVNWNSQRNVVSALVGETIDFSEEAIINSEITTFRLNNFNTGEQIENNTSGIFLASEPGNYRISMSNSGRSIEVTLSVKANTPNYNDVAVLTKIRDENFAQGTTLNWNIEPDPYLWDNVTWDENTRRVTELNLSANNGIGSVVLTGAIDVSDLMQLELFRCDGHSAVTAVDVSGLNKLRELRVSKTGISSLNLSWLSNLERLYSSETSSLSSLFLNGCSNLNYIKMRGSNFEELNFAGLYNLLELDLESSSNLESINLTGCSKLQNLNLAYTNFSSLNLSGFSSLAYLNVSYASSLENLNIYGCANLYNINLSGTLFNSFDLSAFTKLQYVNFNSAINLSDINLTGLTYLYNLDLGGTKIATIDLSSYKNLQYINLSYNSELKDFDIAGCNSLHDLNLSGTSFSTLDLSGSNFSYLYLTGMSNLEELNLEGCNNLYYLYAQSTNLPNLDLSGHKRLYTVNLDYSNNMDSVKLSGCTNLYYLYTRNMNSLSSINVDTCTRLRYLYTQYTSLEEIDLSTCTYLYRAYLDHNKLKKINIKGNSNVRYIYAQNNKLPLNQTASIYNHSSLSGRNINNQDVYPETILAVGESTDYTSDSLININGNNVSTQFQLYSETTGNLIDQNTTGIFTINTADLYYIRLYNSNVTMYTNRITVVDGPAITVAITNDNYGIVGVDKTGTEALTISNPGSDDLTVSSISLPTGYTVSNNNFVLNAGSSIDVSVFFNPTSTGSHSGQLIVHSDATAGDSVLQISGVGGNRAIGVDNPELDFGYIRIGRSNSLQTIISNSGNSELAVSSIDLPEGFTIDKLSFVIAPGGNEEVTINFIPKSIKDYSGTITLNSDALSGTETISVIAHGLERASGLDNNELSSKTIFPNLVKSQICLKGFENDDYVEIFTLNGELVMTIQPDSDLYYVNVEGLASGTYFVKETKNTKSYRFIKQ